MDQLLGSLDTLRWDRPGSTEDPPPRSGLAGLPGQGDAGRIQRKCHSSPTTTVLASAAPGETPRDRRGSDT